MKFKETETENIPKGWKLVSIPDVASNFDNLRKPLSSIERAKMKGGYPYYGAAGIIDWVNDFKYDGKYLLIAEDGTVTSNGNKPTLQLTKGKFWVSNHAHVLQCQPYEDMLFLYYQLKNTNIIPFITGAVQPKLSQENLNKIKLRWIENTTERRLLTKILSDLDSKIELNQQMNQTLEATAQALFKHWFVDFEFPNEKGKPYKSNGGAMVDSELGEIPKDWEVNDVYSFADIVYGAPFASNLFNENGEGLPLIRIRDLKTASPQFYTTEKHPKVTIIQPGDIIVGMDAEFRPTIWIGKQSYLNQRLFLARPNKDCVAKFYVYEALKPHLTFFENSKVGTTVIHLSKTDIESFRFPTPPDTLLNQFKSFIEKIHEKIVVNAQQSSELSNIRDSLLPKLMSGQIRVS